MNRRVKMGLAGATAVAAFGIATALPAQSTPAASKSANSYLLRLCITLRPNAPLCIVI